MLLARLLVCIFFYICRGEGHGEFLLFEFGKTLQCDISRTIIIFNIKKIIGYYYIAIIFIYTYIYIYVYVLSRIAVMKLLTLVKCYLIPLRLLTTILINSQSNINI